MSEPCINLRQVIQTYQTTFKNINSGICPFDGGSLVFLP